MKFGVACKNRELVEAYSLMQVSEVERCGCGLRVDLKR